MASITTSPLLDVTHIIKGTPESPGARASTHHGPQVSLQCPELDLDSLVWRADELYPAADVPLAEIIELLAETGRRLREDVDGRLATACERAMSLGELDAGIIRRAYESLWRAFDPTSLQFQVDNDLGREPFLDSWVPVTSPDGRTSWSRAMPARLVHVVAGNTPGPSAGTIAKAAITKGVHLLKLPSNDPWTAPAILQTMRAIAPEHPTVRSFSAVYWRGGDEEIERAVFTPQNYDKIVAWGGASSIRNASKYLGPGLELVSFDPKNSISLIGHAAFDSAESLARAAEAAALDATVYDQASCVASRIMFVVGGPENADAFADALLPLLAVERPTASTRGRPVPDDVAAEVEALRALQPLFRVIGDASGRGLIIRSDDPVDFYPDGKTVNVVPIGSADDIASFVNVSTQTVGIYPEMLVEYVRDILALAGAQRIVRLGSAGATIAGLPRDGFLPLQRFVRWVNDEGPR